LNYVLESGLDLSVRVAVVCPAEERFDGTGGAIAQWVRATYGYSRLDYRIFCPSVSLSFAGDLNVYANDSSGRILAKALRLGRPGNSLASRAAAALTTRLRLSERVWLAAVSRDLKSFDILHIHNRPRYAAYFRKKGFVGKIILHMHNDLQDYVSVDYSAQLDAVDRVVFCSRFLEQRAKARFGLDVTSVVHNGVYESENFNASKDERALVFVGRLIPEKGALDAIEVYDRLRARGQPYRLDIFGGASDLFGPTAYAEKVKNAVLARQARDGVSSISLTTFAPQDEVWRSMSKATFLIHPCRWDEPFGMVIVEAMSQGTPPIAFSRGGIPEIIHDGIDGYLIDPARGLDGFVEAILENSGHDYEHVASASVATSRRRFSWSRIANDFYECVQKGVTSSAVD
jgi:lipopolysaccharide exporter